MNYLATITDLEARGKAYEPRDIPVGRISARAIFFDKNGKMPILFVTKKNFHKLPGGGVDLGEDIYQALERECIEEIGYRVRAKSEIGAVREIRYKKDESQVARCFFAEIIEKVGEPTFDYFELRDGYAVRWVTLDEAISIFETDKPTNYNGKFIRLRELVFVKEAKRLMESWKR